MLIDNQNRLFFGFALQNLNLEYELRIIKADLLGAVPLQMAFMIIDNEDSEQPNIGPATL